jgi:hypothetical protein
VVTNCHNLPEKHSSNGAYDFWGKIEISKASSLLKYKDCIG